MSASNASSHAEGAGRAKRPCAKLNGPAEILTWLAKTIGGQVIKDRIGQTSLKRQNKTLLKALEESQHRREELEDTARFVAEIAAQRDNYFADVVRLRAENVELRKQLPQLHDGGK